MTTTQHHPCRGPSRRPLGLGSASSGPLRLLCGVVVLAVASGCPSPDASGKYDRFNEETEDERDVPPMKLDLPPPDLAEGESFPDINGVFLVAISTTVDVSKPLQFLADVQTDYDDAGTGSMTIEFQPLSLDVGSTTEPREEVGDAIVVDTDVNTGAFTIPFGETMVTGQANPITGSDILADLSLQGNVRSANAWCGGVDGDVLSPIMVPLAGSTFAAIRLADRSERPLEFPVSCDEIMDTGDDEPTTGM